ncbi:MAG: hypothetical protein RL514_4018 [Verrucomicrobiota bacterium]|jgi:hypothetical protein
MPPPENPSSPPPAPSASRLQGVGKLAVGIALCGVFLLWLHELFVDPAPRQAWKLAVLVVLIPLALTGTAALLLARLGDVIEKWRRKP